MFEEETQSVSYSDVDNVAAATLSDISNVDLIQSADVQVTTVTTVADTKASKRLNVSTLTAQLAKIDRTQVENTAPVVFKDLFAEFDRVISLYKEVVQTL